MSRADVEPNAAMLRWPDVSATHVVFSYANDLWVVPKAGGVASPLASPPGQESFPRFSPDGKAIAFVGNYEGNRDLYTIPIAGGIPTRVTHHPAGETLCDFTPDGTRLLYMTNGLAGLPRQTQLFTSPVGGGLPEKLPVPYAGFGAISPDGTWLAYTPHSTDSRTWKRYRGGMATDVWLYNLKTNASKKITDWEGTDTIPMWVPGGDGKVVYYLSDNGPEHRLNIWSYTIDAAGGGGGAGGAGARTQVTSFKDDDVRWPSVGPGGGGKGEIIFQLGSKLMLLDLGTRQSAQVKISIPGAQPKIKPRRVDAAKNIFGASISPSGKRVVIEARGDLWSAPAKEGVTRNLTPTDGVAERDPAWSPDNKWIAYFSDASGEYELWIRPTDAKPPEEKKDDEAGKKDSKDDKDSKDAKGDKEEKKDEKKDDGKSETVTPPAPVAPPSPESIREPRKITSHGPGFFYNPIWSPDSTMIAYTDLNGRLYVTTIEGNTTKEIDKDPWMGQLNVSWSGDSQWITYSRSDDKNNQGCIWIVSVKTGEKHQVTANMFNSYAPTFDRKGEWLFFASQRSVENPRYADLDNSFIYADTTVLLMVPLRNDVKSPWLPKSDEEVLKKDEKKEDKKDDKSDDKKGDKKDDAKPDDAKKQDEDKKKDGDKNGADAARIDDGVSGTWTGTGKGNTPELAQGVPISLSLKLEDGTKVTGTMTHPGGTGSISGTFDKATGQINLTITVAGEGAGSLIGVIKNGEVTGTWTFGPMAGEWTARRSTPASGSKDGDKSAKKDEKPKDVKIDFADFEKRAILLPVRPGAFGGIAVADGEKLIYARGSTRGEGAGTNGIKVYEYNADEKEEKAVTGGGNFQLSADGKKLLVLQGPTLTIVDASAGGGKPQIVSTDGLKKNINPRTEWKQIFTDAWRLERDYFYEPTMHGVDWPSMRQHYGAMLDDAASKEDVNWIIAEMISELNIGHAYLTGPGDVEDQPTLGVGLLGCDYELDASGPAPAYKIKKIYAGGAWDADARGPLGQPGVGIKEGEYLLAVNGVPIDAAKDPWAAFIGTVDRVTAVTVNSSPAMDGKQRDVLVKPIGSEATLRYRAWIEAKRAAVEQKSGGRIGYIYVPNTGVDGQSDLFRQFFGQRDKDALIIDERWNGGGQIPTRFIELLNRPAVNYWARRDGNDWPWPPDAHFGPKVMLVNGLAGSGGDDFPWLFKHNKLGKVIGTRTWGGLVGISGNPPLIDGGAISVPTFGFYELDGTWGVEGHGVDPDIEVIDDPAKMVNDGDPQLDVAISTLTQELQSKPFVAPKRPASPNRSGMGIRAEDK